MTTNISADQIGKFRTPQQGRVYQAAATIQGDVQEAAERMLTYDESYHDINNGSSGYVLVENVPSVETGYVTGYVTGFGQYDDDKKVVSLAFEEIGAQGQQTFRRLERQPDGSTFYQTNAGTVTVDDKGNLVFDDKPQSWQWDDRSVKRSDPEKTPLEDMNRWIDGQMEWARQDMLSRL